jgi:hypothetical protein
MDEEQASGVAHRRQREGLSFHPAQAGSTSAAKQALQMQECASSMLDSTGAPHAQVFESNESLRLAQRSSLHQQRLACNSRLFTNSDWHATAGCLCCLPCALLGECPHAHQHNNQAGVKFGVWVAAVAAVAVHSQPEGAPPVWPRASCSMMHLCAWSK